MNKGDKCRVRLHSGEVVEATYWKHLAETIHFVIYRGKVLNSSAKPKSISECRFVGPACVLLHEGVSV